MSLDILMQEPLPPGKIQFSTAFDRLCIIDSPMPALKHWDPIAADDFLHNRHRARYQPSKLLTDLLDPQKIARVIGGKS